MKGTRMKKNNELKNGGSVGEIKKQIADIGAMLPGKIGIQWIRCKSKGCKCTARNNPRKHGPYNQLSFTFAGRSSTMNIKEADLGKARKCMKNYKSFQALCKKLVLASIAEVRREGFKQ